MASPCESPTLTICFVAPDPSVLTPRQLRSTCQSAHRTFALSKKTSLTYLSSINALEKKIKKRKKKKTDNKNAKPSVLLLENVSQIPLRMHRVHVDAARVQRQPRRRVVRNLYKLLTDTGKHLRLFLNKSYEKHIATDGWSRELLIRIVTHIASPGYMVMAVMMIQPRPCCQPLRLHHGMRGNGL